MRGWWSSVGRTYRESPASTYGSPPPPPPPRVFGECRVGPTTTTTSHQAQGHGHLGQMFGQGATLVVAPVMPELRPPPPLGEAWGPPGALRILGTKLFTMTRHNATYPPYRTLPPRPPF